MTATTTALSQKTTLRLTRTGAAAMAACMTAGGLALIFYGAVRELHRENEQIRAQVETLQLEVATAWKSAQSKSGVVPLQEALLNARTNALEMASLAAKLGDVSATMPELRTPQYRDPYLQMVDGIKAVHAAADKMLRELPETK